jgi:mannose-6-phosphate isomerase-like protein (cupin superfamily)
MANKYEKCIVRQPKIIESFEKHSAGKYQILMDDDLVPGAEFYIVGGISKKIYQANPLTKHSHDVNEVYVFLSKKGDSEIEIELDDETYVVNPPVSIYIPKGVRHTFSYKRIDSPLTVVAIVQGGKYKTFD